ncbi:ABC transporter permease [Aliidongia dinghuensis]|uniref:ABC transporter permease n=1 Tax=Aliidongia dinghuensis TaxID=1867774 RepID=A0A8J2YP45_9PROT|nr:ABC transporter permease [Aliidongia dinghuensis]GGF01445.1 ABC transporter permease [Aliidongia dinghuensis]
MRLLSPLLLVVIWEAAGQLVHDRMLPPASTVFGVLGREILTGPLPGDLAVTLGRVAAAFLLSMVLGSALGLAMGRWPRVDHFFESWLTVLLNVPALVLIVLLYIWFGLNEGAAVAAVALNKLPQTAVTIREGRRAVDRELDEMARSFGMTRWRTLRHVILPQLTPYFFAAARNGLSLIWKIVLVVELLGRGSGVGFRIQLYFQLFDVPRLLAYTLAFILVMQAFEWSVMLPLERRVNRWRR